MNSKESNTALSLETTTKRLLTEAEVAEYLQCSTAFLKKGRMNGTGPVFIRNGRLVRYRMRDVEKWIESRATNNTLNWRNGAVNPRKLKA